jgi:hypothetical protein
LNLIDLPDGHCAPLQESHLFYINYIAFLTALTLRPILWFYLVFFAGPCAQGEIDLLFGLSNPVLLLSVLFEVLRCSRIELLADHAALE